MSEIMEAVSQPHSDVPAGKPACPVCWREAEEGLAPFDSLPGELRALIADNTPR